VTVDWKVMATTFALLFVAELGDKTQLAVINMTCKHQKPWAIFIGATAALATVTLLGVFGGEVITRFIPGPVLAKISAALFVLLGVLMWFGIL
jgi:putative Ca2+/H+ antiporter (TMEM165/GDT1 family)